MRTRKEIRRDEQKQLTIRPKMIQCDHCQFRLPDHGERTETAMLGHKYQQHPEAFAALTDAVTDQLLGHDPYYVYGEGYTIS